MVHTLSYLLHALVVLSVSLFITIDAATPTFLVPNPDGSTAPRSVSEDESIGTSILTLEGQDTDGDTLTFSILSQNPTSPPFELDSGTGLLKVPSELDAESSTSYTFVFGVRDGSTTTNSVSFVVNVVDVNDNVPVFNQTTYNATVIATDAPGTNVTTVTATDADVSGNTITYRIVSGNSPASFRLNQSTGVITVSASLNAITNPSYILTIQANDGASYAATPATVNITVTAETTTPAETTTGSGDGGSGGEGSGGKSKWWIALIVSGILIICAISLLIYHCGIINICIRFMRKTDVFPGAHKKCSIEDFHGEDNNADIQLNESNASSFPTPNVETRNEDFSGNCNIAKKSKKGKRKKPKEFQIAPSPKPGKGYNENRLPPIRLNGSTKDEKIGFQK